MATHDYTPVDIQRFWSKVAITINPDKCWLWTASLDWDNYGQLSINKKHKKAHRVAWELTYGTIPREMSVLHNCLGGDNPRCCNPKHLFLGTQRQNMEDMTKKGRRARGEQLPQHKLTSEQVATIRRRYAVGGITQRELAEEMNIVRTAITKIVNGTTWKD